MIGPKWTSGFSRQFVKSVASVGIAAGHAADAFDNLAGSFISLPQHFKARIAQLKIEIQMLRRAVVRRLLGHDDTSAPHWVQRVHDQQIETFGSGNGRTEQSWIERGL